MFNRNQSNRCAMRSLSLERGHPDSLVSLGAGHHCVDSAKPAEKSVTSIVALVFLILGSPLAVAAGDVVEAIPNQNGGYSTLYQRNSERCKGSNQLALATDRAGQTTGEGCWQPFNDGYMIFAFAETGAIDLIQINRPAIEKLKLLRAREDAQAASSSAPALAGKLNLWRLGPAPSIAP
jgi:hypothetical protein